MPVEFDLPFLERSSGREPVMDGPEAVRTDEPDVYQVGDVILARYQVTG